MNRLSVLLICTALSACVSQSDADTYEQVEECVANSEIREGESLDRSFQRRAAVAHCKKIVTGEVN